MRHFTFVRSLMLVLALGAVGCSDDESEQPASFTGTLNAASGVPPTNSTATGTVTLDFDGESTVRYRIDVTALTGPTMAHVHSGAAGATGPVRVTLYDAGGTGGTPATPMSGELVEDSFDSSDVQGIEFEALIEELRNGNAYVDVHTSAFPDGEIRGQVRLRQ
jgi:hypothetical protein